jgi:hypothetical protein
MIAIKIVKSAHEFMSDGGRYLAGFDQDAFDGRGLAEWTTDIRQAIPFAGPKDAIEMWRRQSTVRPLRDDGKPNRPLTAHSITFVEIPGKSS